MIAKVKLCHHFLKYYIALFIKCISYPKHLRGISNQIISYFNLKKTLFFLSFLIASLGFSQTDIESHKSKDLVLKIFKFKDSNLDSLLYYGKKIQFSDNYCDQLSGINAVIYYHYRLKEFDIAEKLTRDLARKSNTILENNPNDLCAMKYKIAVYNRLFWIYKNTEEYEKAYNQLMLLSKFVKTINNPKIDKFFYTVSVEMSKAIIKNELKLETDSKQILKDLIHKVEAKKFDQNDAFKLHSILSKKAGINNLLGKTYTMLSKNKNEIALLDSAAYYYTKAYEYAQQFKPPHPDSELMYTIKISEIHVAKKEYQKALRLANKYKKISNGFDYKRHEFLNKAISYYHLKNKDSAIFYANKLIQIQDLKKSSLITAYDILSNEYVKNNQLDSAYKYSKLTLKEFDSARDEKDKTYQLLYDNDIEKIKELNESIVKQEQNKNTRNIYIGVFSVITISLFFIFKRKNYKNEIESISKSNKELLQNEIEEDKQKVAYNIDDKLEQRILAKIDEIDENLSFLSKNFSINSICDELDTNSTYISFVFNKNKNETFKQYYSRKKIEYIVEALHKNKMYKNYSIQALAEEVGYTNASAFTRTFKKHMNVTPSTFIKNL